MKGLMSLRSAALLLVLCSGCYRDKRRDETPKPFRDDLVVVLTGKPQIHPHSSTREVAGVNINDFMAREASRKKWTSFYSPVQRLPPNLTATALAGRGLALGYRQSSWVLDQDSQGYAFYFDEAGNGDLSTAKRYPLSREVDDSWTAIITTNVITSKRVSSELAFEVRVVRGRVSFKTENIRYGIASLEGATMLCAVTGLNGDYGLAYQRVFFDLDHNNRIDLTSDRESLLYIDRIISIGGQSYSVLVDDSGALMKLQKTTARPPAKLTEGSPVPLLTFRSIYGQSVELRPTRGRLMLVDFWSMYCPGCVDEIREIKALISTNDQFEVVGITFDQADDVLSEFVRTHGMDWPIISVDLDHGRVYSMFVVKQLPSFAVIDANNRILCLNCNLARAKEVLLKATATRD
jgi:peroxiredoxin